MTIIKRAEGHVFPSVHENRDREFNILKSWLVAQLANRLITKKRAENNRALLSKLSRTSDEAGIIEAVQAWKQYSWNYEASEEEVEAEYRRWIAK
jgi:hypothetical protein